MSAEPDSNQLVALRLALGILSGRLQRLEPEDYWRSGLTEMPNLEELCRIAEAIVLNAVVNGIARG